MESGRTMWSCFICCGQGYCPDVQRHNQKLSSMVYLEVEFPCFQHHTGLLISDTQKKMSRTALLSCWWYENDNFTGKENCQREKLIHATHCKLKRCVNLISWWNSLTVIAFMHLPRSNEVQHLFPATKNEVPFHSTLLQLKMYKPPRRW